MHHQYWISVAIPQRSFWQKTSSWVLKNQLIFKVTDRSVIGASIWNQGKVMWGDISELRERRFLATHINWKWTFFILEQYFCPNFWTNHLFNTKGTMNTNLILSICFKMRKISPWVDVPHSKMPLLKLSYVASCAPWKWRWSTSVIINMSFSTWKNWLNTNGKAIFAQKFFVYLTTCIKMKSKNSNVLCLFIGSWNIHSCWRSFFTFRRTDNATASFKQWG